MKKKIVTLFGIMLVLSFVAGVGMDTVWAVSESKAREVCGDMNGSWSSRGSSGAECKGVKAQYSGTCSSYEGSYNGSSCVWSKFSSSGDSSNNSGSGSGSGSGDSDYKGPGGENSSSANSTGSTKQGGGDASETVTGKACEEGASVSILGNKCVSDDGSGSSIFTVLNIALQVLTWGIGIAGTFGIVISGIQYMTARDDPAQMTKAKNRIIHIAIGLVAYAVMWAFLQWLLPGGILNGQ